ncbi:YsnF/AvaK domain-containing protein [Bacillus salipaludis]|uniref:YsnF/AvaK domain-containing protein n=1 Tax=Bacillus salipaludis TaxID=2547811 RepID=UPI002E1B5C94|nr:YsnF/AvaK domain-containing protein [Bacillus salipaludis]
MEMNIGRDKDDIFSNQNQEVKLELRKEQLYINKKWLKTGTVKVRKELITEKKTIVVPVTREILVIDNMVFDSENKIKKTKTIRIPLREEQIEIVKNPLVLEDIKIYRRKFQKVEKVVQSLKSEKAHVEIIGNVNVIDNETH